MGSLWEDSWLNDYRSHIFSKTSRIQSTLIMGLSVFLFNLPIQNWLFGSFLVALEELLAHRGYWRSLEHNLGKLIWPKPLILEMRSWRPRGVVYVVTENPSFQIFGAPPCLPQSPRGWMQISLESAPFLCYFSVVLLCVCVHARTHHKTEEHPLEKCWLSHPYVDNNLCIRSTELEADHTARGAVMAVWSEARMPDSTQELDCEDSLIHCSFVPQKFPECLLCQKPC